MKTKCYSVRLESLCSISDKCYLATSYDGSEDLIPKSQVYGQDYDVQKSNAYWVSAWILEKKTIQYSTKKEGWFNKDTGKVEPKVTYKKHIPKEVNDQFVEVNETLIRQSK